MNEMGIAVVAAIVAAVVAKLIELGMDAIARDWKKTDDDSRHKQPPKPDSRLDQPLAEESLPAESLDRVATRQKSVEQAESRW